MKRIEDCYHILPFPLKPSQEEFLKSFTEGEGHFCLTAEAGAGKTTIMSVLKEFYGDKMVTFASTGIANQNLFNGEGGDGTAHRGLSLPTDIHTDEDIRKVSPACQKLLGSSDLVEIIVIEEFAMLNPDNLYVILQRLSRFNKRTSKRKKRNIRLLLIGDVLQLPSVIPKVKQQLIDLYGGHLIFKSKPWYDAKFTVMKLREVNRQQDPVFIEALNVLRYGIESRYDRLLAWLNKRYNPNYDKNQLLLAATNSIVEVANQNALVATGNPIGRYKATVSGKFNKRDCPVDDEICLAVGVDIITLVNHREGLFCNGSFGKVTSIQSDGVWVLFNGETSETFIEPHTFRETETYIEVDVKQEDGSLRDEKRKKEVGYYVQLPVKIAAGLTFHRAQGKTVNKQGVIDVCNKGLYTSKRMPDFGYHGLYVGLSRFTDLNLVTFATKLEREHIKVCRETVEWWNSI